MIQSAYYGLLYISSTENDRLSRFYVTCFLILGKMQDGDCSAWITSNLFVRSPQPKLFFSSASIHLLIIRWTWPSPLSQAQAWVRNHILAPCGVCSTKISLDSSRVFLKYAKIQQEKERRCWQGETPPEASKRRQDIFKQKAWNFRIIFSCLSLSDSNNIKPILKFV